MSQGFPFNHFINNKNTNNSNNINNFLTNNNDNNTQENSLNSSITSELNDEFNEYAMLNDAIHSAIKDKVSDQKYKDFFQGNLNFSKIVENTVYFAVPTDFIKNIIENQYVSLISSCVERNLGKVYDISIITRANNSNNLDSNASSTPSPMATGAGPANSTESLLSSLSQQIGAPTQTNKKKDVRDVKFTLDLKPKVEDLKFKAESDYLKHMDNTPAGKSITVGALIDEAKTFDNFVVGPSNNLAFATAIAVANDPGKRGKYPSLYLYSDSGLGKTHLLHAVANGINDKYPELVVCLITARDFMKEMINHIKNKSLDKFQKKYSEKIDVLMIDDIHELSNRQGTQNEFFHIFNELYNKGKQLIFTSDKKPQEIEGIEERIRTRLQWGLVVDIQKPDIETRLAILKKKANELDLFIPDDALNLIANTIRTSIRELEGSLIRLSAFADVMNTEIDTETVKELLKLNDYTEESKASLDSIAKAVSSHYKITLADMKSKSRNKDITRARHVAIYLSRKIISATQQEIAKFYGNRDHSTVIHAVNSITEKLKNDRDLSKSIIDIESHI
jgi:chromosomal replication initiator protein